jgi:lipopolysaccharide transport system ATP-binding protein
MSKVIKIENLGKLYRLGDVGTGTISHDLNRFWAKIRGKEDPFLKLGEENNRTRKADTDFVWALKDINFDVQQGDVVGIIGRNGAGKSTLLKILSRTTTPTTGTFKVKGRIASLLEVGTGFHPELTGRENIFLNGTILGMSKSEIKLKFDEIVDFSGVDRYIDTPVKRYSSGMYVRLAFSVAAHLNTEILIVDEVLAVGDAEFRKKCLGKMSEVSKVGKTILFVSHEINAIRELCNKGILLQNGKVVANDEIKLVIDKYSENAKQILTNKSWTNDASRPGNDLAKLNFVKIINHNNELTSVFYYEDQIGIQINYEIITDNSRVNICVAIYSNSGQLLYMTFPNKDIIASTKGHYNLTCWLPRMVLNTDWYTVRINAHTFYPTNLIFDLTEVLQFEIINNENEIIKTDYIDKLAGILKVNCDWELNNTKK